MTIVTKVINSIHGVETFHISLPHSNLAPLSKAAKSRKFAGAKNKHPAFGPVNANPVDSQVGGASGEAPIIGGYGNGLYGARPFGESLELINIPKNYNYTVYNLIKKPIEMID